MLSRFIAKSSNFRFLTLISSHSPPQNLKPPSPVPNPNPYKIPRFYSTNGGNNDDHSLWNIASEADDSADTLFGEDLPGAPAGPVETAQKWSLNDGGNADDLFRDPVAPAIPRGADQKWEPEFLNGDGGDDLFGEVMKEERPAAEKHGTWNLGGEDGAELDLFGGFGQDELEEVRLQNAAAQAEEEEKRKLLAIEEEKKKKELEIEEKHLSEILNGPKRAFGDLIAASGITDEMLDTLLALKDFGGIPGLRPLRELEDERYYKNTTKSTKAEMERLKQEEVAKARVQQIDDKGRAYGTGRRKCSIARVWVQPGEGKFVVNDKEFDVYFPMLDHRAILLRPFSETKTLGKWNVNCTVKGGGVSGQVGAIRLGISRALQNWAPDLRPPLRAAGFLTRDSRVVERKKPGKAKARKSFQWVKR